MPDYLPWQENRPLVDSEAYNCLLLTLTANVSSSSRPDVASALITDEDCQDERCSLCEIPPSAEILTVRGLCRGSIFDRHYYYTLTSQGGPLYVGIKDSVIWYDYAREVWMWTTRKAGAGMATSTSRLDSLFLGTSRVDFENTTDICVKERSEKVATVKMTTCLEGSQFTCDDGICVSMELRCDQTINCADGSDEVNCKMIEKSSNYNRRVPPFQFDSIDNKISPTKVCISLMILNILKISEVEHLFSLKFTFVMQWYDHRLKFLNLKSRQSANSLTYKEIQEVWIPNLIFSNTQENDAVDGTKDTEVTIEREGHFTTSQPDVMEEMNIYEGKDNMLTFEMTYSKIFQCEYQLSMYPFDTQTCTVDINVKKV